MTDLRERRRGGRRHTDTKGTSLSLIISFSHTCGGGKVNLMEDFSNSHTSKHRTEGWEGRGGSGGTIGHPGDGRKREKIELRHLWD